MPVKLQSTLSGSPYTRERRDPDNGSTFDILVRELTPGRAYFINEAMGVMGGLLLVLGFYKFLDFGFAIEPTVYWALKAGAWYACIWVLLCQILRKPTLIAMNEKHIVTRPFYFWRRTYDRKIEHSFVLLQHDRAVEEYRRHEEEIAKASLKGKVLRKKAYYGESYIVALVYGLQPVPLCKVYGAKEASRVLARLAYVDRALDQKLGIGRGYSLGPDDQFRIDAGDL